MTTSIKGPLCAAVLLRSYVPDWWVRAGVNLSLVTAQSPHPHGAPTPPEEGSQWAWSFGSGATANLSQRGVWSCQGCLGLRTETPLPPFPLFPHLKEKWTDDTPRSSLSTKYQASSLVVVVHRSTPGTTKPTTLVVASDTPPNGWQWQY